MRVCLLTNYPVPYQQEFLGAVRRAGRVDLQVLFLRERDPDRHWPAAAELEGMAVLASWAPPGAPEEARVHPTLLRELARSRADLYVVCGYSHLAFQAAMGFLAATRKPFVVWAETPRLGQGRLPARALRQALIAPIRLSRGVLAIGSRAQQTWRACTGGKVPVVSFPYFCDVGRYLALPRYHPEASFTVLFSGQMIHRKGVDVLLQAFERAAGERPKLQLLLIGEGPERAALQSSVPEHLRAKVQFEGFVPWEKLPSIYGRADALVIPSRHDGWGLVVNEALAAGLPVVGSTAVGAAVEYVRDGKNGFLIPPEDVERLAAALVKVSDQGAALSAEARRVGRTLSLEVAAERFAELVSTVGSGRWVEAAAV